MIKNIFYSKKNIMVNMENVIINDVFKNHIEKFYIYLLYKL